MAIERRKLLRLALATGGALAAGANVGANMGANTGTGVAQPLRPNLPGQDNPPFHADDAVLDVAIVGAGISGLVTARDLQRAGNTAFAVLEARNRVGGRTLNHDLGNGYFSEAGGQWMGPGQTAVADLARELGIGSFDTYYQGDSVLLAGDGRVAFDVRGAGGTDPVISAKLSALARSVPSAAPWTAPNAKQLDAMTLGDWLVQQGIKPEDRIGWDTGAILSGGAMPASMGLLHYLAMINGANAELGQLEDIRGGAQQTRFTGGSQMLSIKMAQALGDKVRLSCPVSKIEGWDQDVVSIHTAGGTVRARRVVMALSPALCQQITFDPPLPTRRTELQRRWPAHSPARKTAMVYRRPFWREQGLNAQILQARGPVMWSYDNSPEDGGLGVINAFVTQSGLPADPEQAKQALCRIYAQALGKQAMQPLQYHDRDWGRADRWTLSCVSAMPPGLWTSLGDALRPACGKLIWSGTETADIWHGYMDGAVRAGHRSALQALQALRTSGAPQQGKS